MAALVCGISALATGFLFLTLLVAVVGNVLASFALQDIGASGGRLGGRSLALWGIACGVAAIVIWGTVGIVVAVREA